VHFPQIYADQKALIPQINAFIREICVYSICVICGKLYCQENPTTSPGRSKPAFFLASFFKNILRNRNPGLHLRKAGGHA
jgi:hypothetical protein